MKTILSLIAILILNLPSISFADCSIYWDEYNRLSKLRNQNQEDQRQAEAAINKFQKELRSKVPTEYERKKKRSLTKRKQTLMKNGQDIQQKFNQAKKRYLKCKEKKDNPR